MTEPTSTVDIAAAVELARCIRSDDGYSDEMYEIADALIAYADREERLKAMADKWTEMAALEHEHGVPGYGIIYRKCANALLRELVLPQKAES